jgi:hypothetical protein
VNSNKALGRNSLSGANFSATIADRDNQRDRELGVSAIIFFNNSAIMKKAITGRI